MEQRLIVIFRCWQNFVASVTFVLRCSAYTLRWSSIFLFRKQSFVDRIVKWVATILFNQLLLRHNLLFIIRKRPYRILLILLLVMRLFLSHKLIHKLWMVVKVDRHVMIWKILIMHIILIPSGIILIFILLSISCIISSSERIVVLIYVCSAIVNAIWISPMSFTFEFILIRVVNQHSI